MADTEGDPRYWLPPVKDGKPQVLTSRRKHRGDVVAVEGDKGGREFRSLDRPLEKYIADGRITGREYRAGLKLAEAWERSVQSPFVQVRYSDREGGGPALSFVPHGFAAVEYREAMDSVSGERRKQIVHSVCCLDILAVNAIKFSSRRTAERASIPLLREALASLADHFKAKSKKVDRSEG